MVSCSEVDQGLKGSSLSADERQACSRDESCHSGLRSAIPNVNFAQLSSSALLILQVQWGTTSTEEKADQHRVI
jgi:hypothetical protein